jgi:hypothetical protein
MMGKKAKSVIGTIVIILILRTFTTAWAGETDQAPGSEAAEQVRALTPISQQLVDKAITVLSQEWSGMSQAERDTFRQLFDPAGTGEINAVYVAKVLDNYRKIREILTSENQVVYASQNDTCEGQRLYYTDLLRLYVCPYFFEEENELRKARTLIHEMAHMALLVTDRPYYRPTSKQYAKLTPNGSWMTDLPLVGRVLREVLRSDTLYHPDAYAHFALINAGYTNIYASSS